MQTITIGLHTYAVEATGLTRLPYALIGERGGRALLVRDTNRPEILFCPERKKGITDLFTDANGTLEFAKVVRL